MLTDSFRLIVLACLMLLFSCGHTNRPTDLPGKDYVKCTGFVISEYKNKRYISSPVGGKVVWLTQQKSLNRSSHVCTISSPEIINLQQHYLEAVNLYEFTKKEYLRQGDLTVENATSIKKMENARKDFQAAEISMNSLAKQLKLYGISPDNLDPAKITDQINLYSPGKYSINKIMVNTGDCVNAGTNIILLSDDETRLIKFRIPEEYYHKTFIGSEVIYRAAFDSTKKGISKLVNVEHFVDTLSHTFTGFARIQSDSVFISGMSVLTELKINP